MPAQAQLCPCVQDTQPWVSLDTQNFSYTHQDTPDNSQVPRGCHSPVWRLQPKISEGKMRIKSALSLNVLWKLLKGSTDLLLPLTWWEEWPPQIPITSSSLHLTLPVNLIFPYFGFPQPGAELRHLDPSWSQEQRDDCARSVLLQQGELPFPSCPAGFLHPLLGSDPWGQNRLDVEANVTHFRGMAFACSTAREKRSKIPKS